MGKTSFDDFLSIVESGQTKTASLTSSADGNILAKIAAELEGKSGEVAPGAVASNATAVQGGMPPAAEGQVVPAASTIAAANPAVVGQTEGVQGTQLALAGANPAEAVKGEMPAPAKPNQGVVISANDGVVTTSNQLGKTPQAVAAGAANTSGDGAGAIKTAEQQYADQMGAMIADSFLDSLQKQAHLGEYQEAAVFLKEAGLLDGYEVEGMDKTAGQDYDPFEFETLEKIAANEELTYDDMVKAAEEYSILLATEEQEEMDKQAELEDTMESLIGEYEMAKEAGDLDYAAEVAEGIVSMMDSDDEAIKVASELGAELDYAFDKLAEQESVVEDEEFQKEAELVEAQARIDAQVYALDLQKEAAAEEIEEAVEDLELQKQAALLEDPAVIEAAKILKSRGLI